MKSEKKISKPLFNGFQKIIVWSPWLSHIFDGLQEMILGGFVLTEAVIKMTCCQAKQPFIFMSVASKTLLKVRK